MRYWYHPESDGLWTTPDDLDETVTGDGLVEELTEVEYDQLRRERRRAKEQGKRHE